MKRSSNGPMPYDDIAKVCLVERNACPSGLPLVNANKVGKRGVNDLVELAMEIQQVRYLKQQAHEILQEAEKNAELHRVACNFRKVPGNVYHLYERNAGQKYFSMLSPEEWTSPHTYHASYRLEADQSWTALNGIMNKDLDMQAIAKFMQSQTPLNFLALPERDNVTTSMEI